MSNTFPPAFRGRPFRPTAAAWNAVTAAVDPAKRVGMSSPPPVLPRLPAVTGILLDGVNRTAPVFGELRIFLPMHGPEDRDPVTISSNLEETLPSNSPEQSLFGLRGPVALPADGDSEAILGEPSPGSIAICVVPAERLYAIAGLAWVRVRVWANGHRYARVPYRQSEWQDDPGYAESSFYGPMRIVGYLLDSAAPVIGFGGTGTPEPSFPGDPAFRWALVSF